MASPDSTNSKGFMPAMQVVFIHCDGETVSFTHEHVARYSEASRQEQPVSAHGIRGRFLGGSFAKP